MDFELAKSLFVDSEENEHYVALSNSRNAYGRLANSIKNPFKIILMYGRPGTGKSYIMQMFYNNYKDSLNMLYFKEPVFEKEYALKKIYKEVTKKDPPTDATNGQLLDMFKQEIENEIYILLDEAQLYDEETLEWIRILSNQKIFKFIISVHKLDKEDILAKEHFKTRTFETIELGLLTLDEVEQYIGKKLLLGNSLELISLLSKSNYKKIYKYTKGNLRDINRLLYRLIEILETRMHNAKSFFGNNMKNQYIEMAALDLKMING